MDFLFRTSAIFALTIGGVAQTNAQFLQGLQNLLPNLTTQLSNTNTNDSESDEEQSLLTEADWIEQERPFQEQSDEILYPSFSKEIFGDTSHLDPLDEINDDALNAARKYFDNNQAKILNKTYMSVLDFSLHSGKFRWFLIHLKSGKVEKLYTAHGEGSDPNNTGTAEYFSNRPGSHMSSIGAFHTAGTYEGSNGLSLYLDGQESTNNKARERYIVVHGAKYVTSGREKMGRSFGCPALDRAHHERVINLIKGRSLFYIWAKQ